MSGLKKQLMSIGELDELIALAARTEAQDEYGAITASYPTPTANIRAKVRYERTDENESNDQEKFVQEIKIHIRSGSYDVLDWVYWNGKWWDIYAIESTPRQRFMILKARLIEQ